jgi:hypothetical protein
MNLNYPLLSQSQNSDTYGTYSNLKGILDAVNEQLVLIDASNNVSLSMAYINASLAGYATNASVGLAFTSRLGPYATNASTLLAVGPYATNASIGAKFVVNDASIVSLQTADRAFATNASVGLSLGPFVTNASLATAFGVTNVRVVNLNKLGLRDTSGTNGDMFKQDSSLYIKLGGFWNWMLCPSIFVNTWA